MAKQCDSTLHVYRCVLEDDHKTLHESYGYNRKDRQVVRWGSYEQDRYGKMISNSGQNPN